MEQGDVANVLPGKHTPLCPSFHSAFPCIWQCPIVIVANGWAYWVSREFGLAGHAGLPYDFRWLLAAVISSLVPESRVSPCPEACIPEVYLLHQRDAYSFQSQKTGIRCSNGYSNPASFCSFIHWTGSGVRGPFVLTEGANGLFACRHRLIGRYNWPRNVIHAWHNEIPNLTYASPTTRPCSPVILLHIFVNYPVIVLDAYIIRARHG